MKKNINLAPRTQSAKPKKAKTDGATTKRPSAAFLAALQAVAAMGKSKYGKIKP